MSQLYSDTVTKLARIIGHPEYDTGDRAALRRWRPGETYPAAYWRLAARHVPDAIRGDDATWVQLVHLLAHLAPYERSDTRIGDALRTSGYSERRVARLLAADEEQWPAEFERAVRWLASADMPCRALDIYYGVAFPASDRTKFSIARTYYGGNAVAAAETLSTQ